MEDEAPNDVCFFRGHVSMLGEGGVNLFLTNLAFGKIIVTVLLNSSSGHRQNTLQ